MQRGENIAAVFSHFGVDNPPPKTLVFWNYPVDGPTCWYRAILLRLTDTITKEGRDFT